MNLKDTLYEVLDFLDLVRDVLSDLWYRVRYWLACVRARSEMEWYEREALAGVRWARAEQEMRNGD